jgi:hypothetical protein
MKIIKHCAAFLFLISSVLSQAQEEKHFDFGCNFNSAKISGDYTLFEPTKQAAQVVDTILRKISITERTFILKAADVDNAQATILGESERYLLYSNEFLKKFTKDARTKWAAYAVFAHEIGHHVLLHNLKDTSASNRRKYELQADEWAARILASMGASREDALAAVTALPDDNSRYYPKRSARLEMMGIAYEDARGSVDKTTKQAEAGNKTSISIDPKSFNRWNILAKENVRATIDDEKVVIELINLSEYYSENLLSIKLSSTDGNMRVTKVEGIGDSLKYEKNKKIIWRFAEDEVPKINASSAEKLRVVVYEMDDKPQSAGGVGLPITATLVGVGAAGYSFVVRDKALKDHAIYKNNTDENMAVYKDMPREELYNKANASYKQAQIFLTAGAVLAILGTTMWLKKVKINKQAKEAGFGYVPQKPKWQIEPLIANNGGIGIVVRF